MTAALLFLLCFLRRTSGGGRASVTFTPDRSQYFEYDNFTVSCWPFDAGKWTVWRYTSDRTGVSPCGSGWGVRSAASCTVQTVKSFSSGVYWCQSEQSDSSDGVHVSVTDKAVILQSPVLPVTEGHDVALRCMTSPPSELPARFYKDGSLVGTTPTGHMTVRRFSKSHEGAYRCEVEGHGESPSSWLLMKGDAAEVSITASPDTSQWFEYKNLTLTCGDSSGRRGWVVKRSPASGDRISSCSEAWGQAGPAGCFVQTTKRSDSGVYWCESPSRQRSNSINITIYGADTPVLLLVPLLPVTEGHDATLSCTTRAPPSDRPFLFYKDGSLLATEPTGHMTVRRVTKSDEGLYRCEVGGRGRSPSSLLMVRANDNKAPPPLTVARHVLVCSPYVVCTVLMLSVFRRQPSGRGPLVPMTTPPRDEDDDDEADPQYDDVTTEHHF